MTNEAIYCRYCGAPVDPGKDTCPFCGGHYHITGRNIEGAPEVRLVRDYPDGVPVKIAYRVTVPWEHLHFGGLRRAQEGAVEGIAKEIMRANLCEFRTEDDPVTGGVIVYGEVSVLRK